jgi:hypothetical protein
VRITRRPEAVAVASKLLEHEVGRIRAGEIRAGDPVSQVVDVHATSLGTILQERGTDDRPVPVRVADYLGGSNDVASARSQEELRDSDKEPGPKGRDVAGVGRAGRWR